jgi:hypothetical protein
MTYSRFASGLLGLLLSSASHSQSVEHATYVPPFGNPGTTTSWSVYSCPDAAECQVNVDVTIGFVGCRVEAIPFIDRNPNQKKQTIIWVIPSDPAGYEVQFKDPGVVMTEGGQDVDDVKKDKKEHRKKIKQQSMTFLLYNILVEYRVQGSAGPFLPCPPKGPAIVNRG